jgi:hypothetical protein
LRLPRSAGNSYLEEEGGWKIICPTSSLRFNHFFGSLLAHASQVFPNPTICSGTIVQPILTILKQELVFRNLFCASLEKLYNIARRFGF